MSRAALLCCTALALVLSAVVAQATDKPNPACLHGTPSEAAESWLGGLFQFLDMVDCSWLKWSIEHHDPLTERLARESKPFEGQWPASPIKAQQPSVKCLKPDGTEEPCESRHTAQNQDRPPSIPQESCRQIDNCAPVELEYFLEGLFETLPVSGIKVLLTTPPTVTILSNQGGVLPLHDARWREVATHGGPVRVLGPCGSGCTLVAAYISKDRRALARAVRLISIKHGLSSTERM
jgi:hypothetical protein